MGKVIRLMLGLVSLVFISCGNIGKTTMDELSYTEGNRDEICVIKGTRPYSGEFWSNDGNTIKMTANSYGIIQSVSFYHPNGKLALYYPIGSDGYFHTDDMAYYDEDGGRMKRKEWTEKYDSYFGSMWDRFVPKKLKDVM